MKILFKSPNNNPTQVQFSNQKKEVSFGAGLTAKFANEILNSDILEISNNLAKKGIESDFKNNKVIAWCSEKTVDIFQELNEKFNLKLALPQGIFVEDFGKLNMDDAQAAGFCNFAPTFLNKNSTKETPPETVYFNTFESALGYIPANDKWRYNWNKINTITDKNFADKFKSTDHFLEPFLHEFLHVAHANKMLEKFGGKTFLQKVKSAMDEKQIAGFQKKYGEKVSQICMSALIHPLDTVACDLSRVTANSLDKTTLAPIRNPFINTPYESTSTWQRIISQNKKGNQELSLDEILRNFWNGKFD